MRHCVCYPFYEEMSFECPYGATVFCIPIVFHGAFLGYIQGGYAHMHIVPERGSLYYAGKLHSGSQDPSAPDRQGYDRLLRGLPV